jgi:hypothetical protein
MWDSDCHSQQLHLRSCTIAGSLLPLKDKQQWLEAVRTLDDATLAALQSLTATMEHNQLRLDTMARTVHKYDSDLQTHTLATLSLVVIDFSHGGWRREVAASAALHSASVVMAASGDTNLNVL